MIAASNVLRNAPTAEPDLFMFLCEAVWFWLEAGALPLELAEPVEQLLRIGLAHFDPNIRLASAISTARYCTEVRKSSETASSSDLVGPLISSLGHLVSNSYLAASTYFERVYRTCQYVLPNIDDERQAFLLAGLDQLKNVPTGEGSLAAWFGTIEDSRKFAVVLLVLLWRSLFVREVQMVSTPFDGQDVHALRLKVQHSGRDEFVYAMCAIEPDPGVFQEWMEQAKSRGLVESGAFAMRLAARPGTLSQAADNNIICGGDLIDLVISDARFHQELETLIRRK